MENSECSICTELILPIELFYLTPCFHIFHKSCIDEWIEISIAKESNTYLCPLCRYEIPIDSSITTLSTPVIHEPFASSTDSHIDIGYRTSRHPKTFMQKYIWFIFICIIISISIIGVLIPLCVRN